MSDAARFAADLAALGPVEGDIGIAVSGGPDSVALLLLAREALGPRCRAATVDHQLRSGSAGEAAEVAAICAKLGIAHDILTVEWDTTPDANLQARAREARYASLSRWAVEHRLGAVLTGHHADDQAETLLMRLARGSGVAGLGGIRPTTTIEATGLRLLRPLLGWRRRELAEIVATAGISPLDDPANHDLRHDRTRVRHLLAKTEWIDPARLAGSAAALRDVDDALSYALTPLIDERLRHDGEAVTIDAAGLPREMLRRLLLTGFERMAAPAPRGPELMRSLDLLTTGRTATLSGLKLTGGAPWRLTREPPRKG